MERYIEKCFESIVNQTYRDLEIILVDDGSTDNSAKICDEWLKKDERIRVSRKTNDGLSDAKNGSPGQTRTDNLEVNSFLLHH